jgi:hypothetical protein
MNHVSLAFLGVLFLAGPDLGAQTENGFYVELNTGLSLVNDYVDKEFLGPEPTVSFENAANFGGAFGYRFRNHYRGEINISHRKADVSEVDNVAGSGDAELMSFMVNFTTTSTLALT